MRRKGYHEVLHPFNLNINGITSREQAISITGSLSHPSKIPAWGYSLSALDCKMGTKLSTVKGSCCESDTCYAKRGWYLKRKTIQKTMKYRLKSLDNPKWVDAMVFLVKYYICKFFRWHDSGDLQSVNHLHKIVKVAEACPDTWFWLPTREYEIVTRYKKLRGDFPKNLQILLSAHMIDGAIVDGKKIHAEPPTELAKKLGVRCSIVSTDPKKITCPASTKTVIVSNGKHSEQHGYCGSCRNCWNPEIPVIVYKYH